MNKDEALKLALEALEWNMAYLPTLHDDDGTTMAIEAVAAIKAALAQPEQEIDWKDMYDKEKRRSAMWLAKYEAVAGPAPKAYPQAQPEQEPVLQDIEQYRLQMAGISTAAIGYWKEGDSIHPDYDTLALRDVAKLYSKYDALYKARWSAQPEQESKSTIRALTEQCAALVWEKDEFKKQVQQYEKNGVTCQTYRHKVEQPCAECNVDESCTTPPKREWVGLTDEEAQQTFAKHNCTISTHLAGILARAIEAKLKELNT